MKISYDKTSDALSIVFKRDRISKDVQLSANVFAGLTRSGDLVEIQILEVSHSESSWFTLEAAAKYLGKSERTLLRWIKSGQLKSKCRSNDGDLMLEGEPVFLHAFVESGFL